MAMVAMPPAANVSAMASAAILLLVIPCWKITTGNGPDPFGTVRINGTSSSDCLMNGPAGVSFIK